MACFTLIYFTISHTRPSPRSYSLTNPIGMARWVGVGTQQPRAGFEPTTSRLQVRHCTTQPPGNGECMFSAGCVPIFCRLYDAIEECNVVIGRLQTGVACVTVLWLVVNRQVSLWCLPSQFRLLQVCESRQRHGSLEGIDALLGVLIVLSYRLIITFMSLTHWTCDSTVDCVILRY